MIDRHGRALLAAALLLLAAQSPAPAGILIPQGPWVVDYADTQCSASRKYDPCPILFAIRPAPNGETYELLLGRERSGPHYAEELEGSVDFGRGPIKAWLLHMAVAARSSTSTRSGLVRRKWQPPVRQSE